MTDSAYHECRFLDDDDGELYELVREEIPHAVNAAGYPVYEVSIERRET